MNQTLFIILVGIVSLGVTIAAFKGGAWVVGKLFDFFAGSDDKEKEGEKKE